MRKFFLLCSFFTAIAAPAQIHDTRRPDTSLTARRVNLNPVVVTGSGHHRHISQTATPVDVITAEDMSARGITTFSGALESMIPQVSMAPNSMGSFLRLNGLGGKYILILVNGHKISGDISGDVDISRVNLARVKRVEVLDGAASSLYGSDAIAGVINIITDEPVSDILALTTATRVSGKGQLTESVNLDICKEGFGSYTSFTHDEADSYQNNDKMIGGDGSVSRTIAPLFTGYNSNTVEQRFTYKPNRHLAVNGGGSYNYNITDRPKTNANIAGGTSYEMRHEGWRGNIGAIYLFSKRHSVQGDITCDSYGYGKEYDVATSSFAVGDYVMSKKQHSREGDLKAILALTRPGCTIFGVNGRRDWLKATNGNVDRNVYIWAVYAQHEQQMGRLKLTAGLRYNYHETFLSRLTPKAALMYSIGHLNVRAAYSGGFRAPGLDELYYHYYAVNRGKPQIIFGNSGLKAETSHYLSLEAEWRSTRIITSLEAFRNNVNDMVVKQTLGIDEATMTTLRKQFPEMTEDEAALLSRYSYYMNSDKGEVKGVRMNVSVNLSGHLYINASYIYTYARTKSGEQWTVMDRSIRHAATIAANYHKAWRRYGLNININGRLQSKTYYTGYENAPGYGVWNIMTAHSIDMIGWCFLEPSLGIDNIFDKADRRPDTSLRRYALFSPGRMLVAALKVKLK